MSKLIIPKDYKPFLNLQETELAIKSIKDTFEKLLAENLNLSRVTAPLFVLQGTGLNDDLNGIERAVTFPIKAMGDKKAEVVHSLAKWKRMILADYKIETGNGIYTDMNAIRADEDLSNIHSLYVDQWDWEKVISLNDRNIDFLKSEVEKIFNVLKCIENQVSNKYQQIKPILPDTITFIDSQKLLEMYPNLDSKMREKEIVKKYKAVFISKIGDKLSNGISHDGRAPDYDDWNLNGDIVLYNPILDDAFEISSMGIRVDEKSLLDQLTKAGKSERRKLLFHQRLLNNELPLSIGGGIGQSRLCMYFLRKAHIGEIQASIWPEEMREECFKNNIFLV